MKMTLCWLLSLKSDGVAASGGAGI
jgi:hypothetical protein